MAEFVNFAGAGRLLAQVVLVVTLAGQFGAAMAQSTSTPLSDPTRPANASLETAGNGTELAQIPVLQSVLISPRRKVAVISGQTLHVGEKFGDATLIKISAQEVVLKNGSELQTLKLYPGVEKQLAGKPAKIAGKPAMHSVKDH